MPNWVVGNIQIRGSKDNIKRFLLEQLRVVDAFGECIGETVVKDNILETLASETFRIYHIKDTYRCFVHPFLIDIDKLEKYEYSDDFVLDLSINGAWEIESFPFVGISKKYDIYILIKAEEEGGKFEQFIEIDKGRLITDK